jgi:hydrogenase maturation factor
MCQAPVGKVVAIGEGKITVEYNGKRRELRSKLQDIKPGEYVQFSLDIAIDRIDEEEALMILGGMA